MIDYIKSDLLRYRGKITFLDFLICFFWNKAFNALFWMRVCAHSKILKIFCIANPQMETAWQYPN